MQAGNTRWIIPGIDLILNKTQNEKVRNLLLKPNKAEIDFPEW